MILNDGLSRAGKIVFHSIEPEWATRLYAVFVAGFRSAVAEVCDGGCVNNAADRTVELLPQIVGGADGFTLTFRGILFDTGNRSKRSLCQTKNCTDCNVFRCFS